MKRVFTLIIAVLVLSTFACSDSDSGGESSRRNKASKKNYSIEMEYNEKNIENFIEGIEDYAESFAIDTIYNIEINNGGEGDKAYATIYVKDDEYREPQCIDLSFVHNDYEFNVPAYGLMVEAGKEITPTDTVAKVAVAVEKMLAGETRVMEAYDRWQNPPLIYHPEIVTENGNRLQQAPSQDPDFDGRTCYTLGKYYCIGRGDTIMGNDEFEFVITTEPLRTVQYN